MSFIYGKAVAAAAQYEETATKLAAGMGITLEEAKARLERLSREVVLPSWMQSPGTRFGGEPGNPGDRRTVRLAGKPKHFVQVEGQLRLRDGESPWT